MSCFDKSTRMDEWRKCFKRFKNFRIHITRNNNYCVWSIKCSRFQGFSGELRYQQFPPNMRWNYTTNTFLDCVAEGCGTSFKQNVHLFSDWWALFLYLLNKHFITQGLLRVAILSQNIQTDLLITMTVHCSVLLYWR